MNQVRMNRNRGYMNLNVWKDAIDLYQLNWQIFRKLPNELCRIKSQTYASVDSIHRNIAEGYCRRSLNEYLNFLNYANASLGESVSGFHAYLKAGQISQQEFEQLDSLSYKLENGLQKLAEALNRKRNNYSSWNDNNIIEESNEIYGLD